MQFFSQKKTGFPPKCKYNFPGQCFYFWDRNEMYLSLNTENIDTLYTMGTIYFLILWFLKENILKLSIEKNITKTLWNIISQNKCDRLQICYNSLEWTVNIAVRWGNILSYPLNNEKYVALYGICVHLHYGLHFSQLQKVTIATKNLRSNISHKNQRSKI